MWRSCVLFYSAGIGIFVSPPVPLGPVVVFLESYIHRREALSSLGRVYSWSGSPSLQYHTSFAIPQVTRLLRGPVLIRGHWVLLLIPSRGSGSCRASALAFGIEVFPKGRSPQAAGLKSFDV
jgi:hypothetical protein